MGRTIKIKISKRAQKTVTIVLMQPQQPATTSPPSPTPEYNFIFNDQKPKRGFSLKLPASNNIGKLALLIVSGGAVIGVLIIIASSLFSPKINKAQITDVIARAQEISRVSDLVSQRATDINTQNLASTTSATLTSNEVQLLNYLSSHKTKIPQKDLSLYLNKKTDDEVQSALQNNRLSEYYYSYLKKNMNDYETAIKTAYNTAGGPIIKSDLNGISISATTILSTQQLATAQ